MLQNKESAEGENESQKKERCSYILIYTVRETNIAPENGLSQKETSILTIHFTGYVSFREGTWKDRTESN